MSKINIRSATGLCDLNIRIWDVSSKPHAVLQIVHGMAEHIDRYDQFAKELAMNGVDVTVDNRSEKIGYKIREARLARLPYMLVVGEKEEAEGLVSVRSRFAGDEGQKSLDAFIDQICKEIRTKEIRKEEVQE